MIFFYFSDLDSRYSLFGSGVLFIKSVQENDAGTYQCRADNNEDSLDATAVLDVQVGILWLSIICFVEKNYYLTNI